jgi:hypothetical protein
LGAFVDGVIFPDWRTAAIFVHSPLLHSLTIRILKALVGTVITAAALVVAYLVIAPIAKAIRRHTNILSGGRPRGSVSDLDGEAIPGMAPDSRVAAGAAVPDKERAEWDGLESDLCDPGLHGLATGKRMGRG